jgi:Glycine-zipper domain
MHRATTSIALLIAASALGACAVAPPTGPSVMALPAQGKSFEQFQQDDATCQQYASARIGNGSPQQAANESGVGSAVVGTAVGAAAGALIGAAAGNPAAGAAIGGGSGLLLGSAAGVSNAYASGAALQHRYDMAYVQCMSAKGESVPMAQNEAAAYPPNYAYQMYPAYPGYYYPGYAYYYYPYPY